MNKLDLPRTLICLILDRSGSMSGKEEDVVGGVNTFIEEQRKLVGDEVILQMVRFDHEYDMFRQPMPLADVPLLTSGEYVPRGNTALLDAVGRTLEAMATDWKERAPDKAIVVIVTDGQENASTRYTKDKIQAMVKTREGTGRWSFVYLGADVNAFTEAATIGIAAQNTAQYTNTKMGTQSAYATMSASVGSMRAKAMTPGNVNWADAELGKVIPEQDPKQVKSS